VPGVTSPAACAAAADLPLADHDDAIAILPASYRPGRILQALASFDCVVLLKISSALDAVLDTLELAGFTERAVVVERCGDRSQRIHRTWRRSAAPDSTTSPDDCENRLMTNPGHVYFIAPAPERRLDHGTRPELLARADLVIMPTPDQPPRSFSSRGRAPRSGAAPPHP